MDDLKSLPNIGKEVAQRLNQVGIDSAEQLKALGSEKAFLRLQAVDPGACYCMLCGLEGAIQGIRWHNLSPERKMELKHFIKIAKNK
jgi:DNA transformation protein and related proteins